MPRFLRFLFIFYVPDLSICSSITRLSLSLSPYPCLFYPFSSTLSRCMKVYHRRHDAGDEIFCSVRGSEKGKTRFKAITSASIRIKRRVTVPRRATSFERDAKNDRKNIDKFEMFEKYFFFEGRSFKYIRVSLQIRYCKLEF